MIFSLVISSLWAILLLITFLVISRWGTNNKISNTHYGWLIVLIIASLARLIPDSILPGGAVYEVESYQIVADLTNQGQDVYTHPAADQRHPYLPFQMYWMAFARWSSTHFNLSFAKVVKLAPIAADILIAILLYFSFIQISPQLALLSGLLYATNPITVYVSAYHGQFDAIPALLLLLALLNIARYPPLSGFWLGLGILSKSWPALACPTLISNIPSNKQRWLFLSIIAVIPILGVLIYSFAFHSNLLDIIGKAISYNRGIGVWGYTYLIGLLAQINLPLKRLVFWLINYGRWLTLIILGLAWFFKARKESPANSVLTILVIFLAGTHAFSIQYLMWVVPFALLTQDIHWLRRFTLGAFIYMFLAYNTLILAGYITNLLPMPQADLYIIMPAGLPAWLILVGWALKRLQIKPPQASATLYDVPNTQAA